MRARPNKAGRGASRPAALLNRTFRSLRVRNYRLYFLGQIVSFTGTWMQSVAQAWLVLRLTGSGVALGTVVALQFLPIMVAGPLAGVVADRVDKRRLIVLTQAAAASVALALGLLTITGVVRLWMVYALAFVLGLVNLVDMPARQSFVSEMVDRDHLPNAVSLNGVIVNGSRVIGPALAGLLIGTVGIGACFLVNAASYLAVITGLVRMDPGRLTPAPRAARARGQMREGLRYAWSRRGLRFPLAMMAVVGTAAFNFSVVIPLLVRFSFGREAQAYGVLLSATGVGSVLGGLAVAWWGRTTHRFLAAAALALGASLLAVAAAPSFEVALVAVLPLGAATSAFVVSTNSLLQLGSAPEMRGRVLSLFMVVFLGSTPPGGLLAGWVAEGFGPRAAVGLGAVASVAAGAVALVLLARRGASHPAPGGEPAGVEDRAAGAGEPAPVPGDAVRRREPSR